MFSLKDIQALRQPFRNLLGLSHQMRLPSEAIGSACFNLNGFYCRSSIRLALEKPTAINAATTVWLCCDVPVGRCCSSVAEAPRHHLLRCVRFDATF